jgi:hypothetical protein
MEVSMGSRDPDRKHPLQRLMDNPWLLLALGVLVPFVSYTLWGWVELWLLPPATLP